MSVRCAADDAADANRGADQFAGLPAMHAFQCCEVNILPLGLDVRHLARHHAGVSRSQRQFLYNPDLRLGIKPLVVGRPADEIERHREQGVAGQDRHRLADDFVVRQFSPPVVVVIHGRKIVVYQGVSMDEFQGGCAGKDRRRGTADRLVCRDRQDRPDSFACGE